MGFATTITSVAMGSVKEMSPDMTDRYVLKQANSRQEMDGIMDVIWAANYTPYEPFAQLFFPVLGFTQADREASILESKERFWALHQSDISSNWFYVVDSTSGRPVGCAQWQIHVANPFSKGTPKLTAPWWPEEEHRAFCESMLNQVYKPRANWMRRPHLALNWMAVIPTHRNRGIGGILMAAGIHHADELRLECWLEASSMGKPLYERFGFRSLLKIGFDTERRDASDVWRKCEHEMTPNPLFAMWRPKGGRWEDGKDASRLDVKLPWDLGVE